MPKTQRLPLSALFAIHKPSGPTCMSILSKIKPLLLHSPLFMTTDNLRAQSSKKKWKHRNKGPQLKVGQGGTLDPLASGVLVIGVGQATKTLGQFLDCDKEYEVTMLLGSSTDSYDSEGSIVRHAPWSHITEDAIRAVLPQFTGPIKQTPPIYSALKMEGKPLYEYARSGTPLPKPIEKRSVTIHSLSLLSFTDPAKPFESSAPNDPPSIGHTYKPPSAIFTQAQRDALQRTLNSKANTENGDPLPPLADEPDPARGPDDIPPVISLRVACSGGTYVRSLVHDIGTALGSAAHVVKLERTRQGSWGLDQAISWNIWRSALDRGEDGTKQPFNPESNKNKAVEEQSKNVKPEDTENPGNPQKEENSDKDGWKDDSRRPYYEWEEAVMEKWEVVENKKIVSNSKPQVQKEAEAKSDETSIDGVKKKEDLTESSMNDIDITQAAVKVDGQETL